MIPPPRVSGFTIHRCGLGCRKRLHFHCVYCQSTLSRKIDFIKHLSWCKQKRSAAANTTSAPTATAQLVKIIPTAASPPALTTTSSHPTTPHKQVQRVKPVLHINCPICQVVMNKRNLKKHIERKHTSRHEDKPATACLLTEEQHFT